MRVTMSQLDERIRSLETLWSDCRVCARDCGVNRLEGETGVCGLGRDIHIYKEHVHYGEEACVVPSHTVYLTGCSFRCLFCSDDGAVHNPKQGVTLSPEALAALIERRRMEGARNVHFVGGEPSVNALGILEALRRCPPETHVVWNTNAYHTPALFGILSGVVDTWIADLKFGSDACGRLAGITDHARVVHRAIGALEADPGALIVRHLVMPGHVDCCTAPALSWLAAHAPRAIVNVMTGWLPLARARLDPILGSRLGREDRDRALALFAHAPLERRMVDGKWWSAPLDSAARLNG
jgi:putative pyruvate formate lyase activating enzyme